MLELKRILLAEDNTNDAELTLAALSEHHLSNDVIHVRDGAEAMDYLLRHNRYEARPIGNPAVVLLDLKMPKVDGLEVLRRIRQAESLREVPVVVLTSSREDQDIIETYHLGINAYVVKPVAFSEFVAAVKNLGLFWGILNEPPPGTARSGKR